MPKLIYIDYDTFGDTHFSRVSTNIKIHDSKTTYDILRNLSLTGMRFFWNAIFTRDPQTNIFIKKANTPTEQNKIGRGYKQLRKVNILQRIKQQHYLVNPWVVLPTDEEFNSISANWWDMQTPELTQRFLMENTDNIIPEHPEHALIIAVNIETKE